MMKRTLASVGISAIAFALTLVGADAKTVYYEINGKQYSYDSSSRKDVAAARKRIDAANAADRANAAAQEEKVRNPFVSVVGSETQRAAAAAQDQLEQALSEEPQTTGDTAARPPAAPERPATKPRGKAAQADAPHPSVKPVEKPRTKAAAVLPEKEPQQQTAAPAEPEVRSVYYDKGSGIKTTFLSNGTVLEEMFDPSVLSKTGDEGKTPVAQQPSEPASTGSTSPRDPGQTP